jgi:hypothetical protein
MRYLAPLVPLRMIRLLTLLALLIPFAANATDTPVIDLRGHNDTMLFRQEATPNLYLDLDTANDSIAICTHFNWDPPGGESSEADPSILMQIDGVYANGGFLRYHVDEEPAGVNGHNLMLYSSDGDSNYIWLDLGSIKVATWYKSCAVVKVNDPGPDMTYELYYQKDGGSAVSSSKNDIPDQNWDTRGLTAYGIGKGVYDDNNDGSADSRAHPFLGKMAATVVVRNPIAQEITDYLDGQDPEVIWAGRLILNPLMDPVTPDYEERADTVPAVDWVPDETLPTTDESRTFTEAGGPAEVPTYLGVTLTWLEDLWMSIQAVGVGDAN